MSQQPKKLCRHLDILLTLTLRQQPPSSHHLKVSTTTNRIHPTIYRRNQKRGTSTSFTTWKHSIDKRLRHEPTQTKLHPSMMHLPSPYSTQLSHPYASYSQHQQQHRLACTTTVEGYIKKWRMDFEIRWEVQQHPRRTGHWQTMQSIRDKRHYSEGSSPLLDSDAWTRDLLSSSQQISAGKSRSKQSLVKEDSTTRSSYAFGFPTQHRHPSNAIPNT